MSNNQRALIGPKQVDEPSTIVEWQERVRAGGVAEPGQFGLGELHDETAYSVGALLPSDLSLQLVNDSVFKEHFHDLTSYSVGLQTNAATGGWKRDLSLFMEQFDQLGENDLFTFKPTPETYIRSNKAVGNTSANANALMYNWAGYREENSSGNVWANIPPICSWTALADYVGQYKDLGSIDESATIMDAEGGNISGNSAADRFQYLDQVRRAPQIARIQWILSYSSREEEGEYIPSIIATPFVVLWNPYNVQLEWPDDFVIWIRKTGIAPLNIEFQQTRAGEENPYNTASFSLINMLSDDDISFKLSPNDGNKFVMPPGSNIIYSLDSTEINDPVQERIFPNNRPNRRAINFRLEPGYRPLGGVRMENFGLENMQADDVLRASEVSFFTQDAGTGADNPLAPGIWLDTYIQNADGSESNNALRMIYPEGTIATGVGDNIVNELYPTVPDNEGIVIGDVDDASFESVPFVSTIFAHRVASTFTEPGFVNIDINDNVDHNHLYTRGMLMTNPLTVYSEVGDQDESGTDDNDAAISASIANAGDTGVFHPANAPYDFAFHRIRDWNDSSAYVPQVNLITDNNNNVISDTESYIVTGLSADTGLTRCMISEIPIRPIQSMAQLQHFDVRNNNLTPPFQYNIIGNSSASPIFAADQLYVSTKFNDGYCNDDPYVINHILFDDWFLSSLSADVTDFGSSVSRPVEQVYADFFNAVEPLPNFNYIVSDIAREDAVANTPESSAEQDATTPGRYAYETIASDLIVSGMFNVNNVSVEAWKAILKQGKGNSIPYIDENGRTRLTDSNPNGDLASSTYPFPRTSIAGDLGNGSTSTLGGVDPDAAQVAGFPELTESQVDSIAEEIVRQIRERSVGEGPFLSLAEFVNRKIVPADNPTQMSHALAGPIQRSLDILADQGSDIFDDIKSKGIDIDSLPPGDAAFKFPEASFGSSLFGLPGWLRQADILTPIAPVISVRDDTFTIRAYGDARDVSGAIIARAWCEAVVQRKGDFVEKSDHATTLLSDVSETNKRYGRAYFIVSFRWMNSEEI